MKFIEVLRSFLHKIDAEEAVDYVCGTEALPLPFSPQEEKEMLDKLERGEKEEADKIKGELIKHNLRLVVYIARKFDNTGVDGDDLVSIGTIGLIKAINSFRADKNIKLATYASRCIENEILMYLRRTARIKSEISFDEPLNTDWDGSELLLSDILGTEADIVLQPIEADADCQMLLTALNTLTRRERAIITLRYGLGGRREQTQKEVADRLGISQSYISRLEKRTLQRLRRELQRLG